MAWTMCLILIAGLNLHSFSLVASGLLLLLLLVSGYALFLLGMRARAIVKKASITKPTATEPAGLTMPGQTAKMITRVSKPALLILAGLAIGGPVGYQIRNAQLASDTRILSNVLVLKQFDESRFMLQTEDGQAFKAEFCPDSHINFERGWKLKMLAYEQRKGCKSINGHNLGFLIYKDGRGEPVKFTGEIADAGY